MNKEVISDRQGIALMSMFIIGTSAIFTTGLEAKKDIWIAVTLAFLASLPIVLIISRLHNLFINKDLFDICEACFGSLFGRIIEILYIWFFFHTGILVFMNFTQFVITVSFPETPQIAVTILYVILSAWMVKISIELVGRWASFFLPVVVFFIVITVILSIRDMDINNIQPILYDGIKPVLKGSLPVLSFPFTQVIVFSVTFPSFKTKKSPYKILIYGLLIGWIIVFLTSIMNVLVLGVDLASFSYYPTFTTASKVSIGELLQSTEVVVAIIFSLGALIKTVLFLLAACKGVTKIFRCTDYRFIVIPVALLMINLSYHIHDSLMEYFKWISEVWIYYAFPFQVILPMIIWIIAEIKSKYKGFANSQMQK